MANKQTKIRHVEHLKAQTQKLRESLKKTNRIEDMLSQLDDIEAVKKLDI